MRSRCTQVREEALEEFAGRFRPQAPGCSFNVQQANRALRAGSEAQMRQAAAALTLPQLGELAVSK